MRIDHERFAAGIHDYLARALRPLAQRIDALEGRQSETLADAWKGTWSEGRTFERGQLTTHRGSLWLAMRDTGDKPGESESWKLIVKAGRDLR